VSLYRDRVSPVLIDLGCSSRLLVRWRRRTVAGLSGVVLEIGQGSARNLPLLPAEVTRVLAVEPSGAMWSRGARRREAATMGVERVGREGERLDLTAASVDAALITFTLCSVADAAAVLGEVARVLRPGGRLHLLEHGLAPDARTARWQRRLDPLEQRLAGGCSLVRDPLAELASARFDVLEVEQAYAGGPRSWTYLTRAVATPRAT
jgi:ubiquinone/menaquinone biosynthesis C-methylase UbiE